METDDQITKINDKIRDMENEIKNLKQEIKDNDNKIKDKIIEILQEKDFRKKLLEEFEKIINNKNNINEESNLEIKEDEDIKLKKEIKKVLEEKEIQQKLFEKLEQNLLEKYELETKDESIILNTNKNIKINFLGDSITNGSKLENMSEQRYTRLLEKKLKINAINSGLSGCRIAKVDLDNKICFLDRIQTISKNSDFTFVFGGINDYKNGSIIGDKASDKVDTFYGAMKLLISKLLELWSNEKICFILPLPTTRKSPINEPLTSYLNVIKELCIENKIDFLDLSNEFNNKKLFADGLHPNKKGHQLLAKEVEKYLVKKGIINI